LDASEGARIVSCPDRDEDMMKALFFAGRANWMQAGYSLRYRHRMQFFPWLVEGGHLAALANASIRRRAVQPQAAVFQKPKPALGVITHPVRPAWTTTWFRMLSSRNG